MSATPQLAPSAQKLILIVDDTPINIGVISGALKDSYKTKVATNGEKALALASAEEKPDLILLDIMMPGMDGYEVCSRLKADPATSEIPVIFLTGQTSAEEETRGFEVGAVDYVHKPFSPSVVKARVRSHILLREARAQLASQLQALNTELEMARQIQLSILPHSIPKLAGLDIAAHYLPMTSVAGDFYDFIQIDDKHIGILIADVSGHGLPSALIASMLQVALSGQAGHATEPAKVLLGLNRALCGKFTQNFVTAAYVYVDLENNLMRYAGAGHPPMLQWRNSTGRAAQIVENGLFLGMFGEASYKAIEFPLEPGDRYVLYTDGIPEAANSAQEQFGADRLMRFIENQKDLAADQFSQMLLNDLSRWSNQPTEQGQQDDITLLVIDYKHQ
ncbi:MAG TPA: SpoIIE family protein phosphatase [Candidatus Sulfotelmatobacter sp.]|jgi:sigma-B regulation protein RsbU (phosphoserine phosphatase)|nr:SpoIIE family protein phosphatase [Candidatus Sulfotelmatobacter sp.]